MNGSGGGRNWGVLNMLEKRASNDPKFWSPELSEPLGPPAINEFFLVGGVGALLFVWLIFDWNVNVM